MLSDSTFWDRAFFLLIGLCLGVILGWTSFAYKVAREAVQEAHKAHDDVIRLDEKVHHLEDSEHKHIRNEDGLMHTRVWGNVALAIIVLVTVYAAFTSNSASDKTKDAVDENTRQTEEIIRTQNCTESTVNEALQVIAKRTKLNSRSSLANLELQRAQAKFLAVSAVADNRQESLEAFDEYLTALNHFVEVASKVAIKGKEFPYPKASEYRACLEDREKK